MYRTLAERSSFLVLAALALSFAGCLGSISDTPEPQENVGTGTGVEEDKDPITTGDGDQAESDDDGDAPASDDSDDRPSGDDDASGGDDSPVDSNDDAPADAPADEPTGEDPPADDPPAEEPPPGPADPEAESLARGEQSYTQLCVGCHGADGNRAGGVQESSDVAVLAGIIDGFMPLGNAAACSGSCPEDVARYIIERL